MDCGWQRRRAVEIAAMLPEETENARLVLKLALELVDGFLAGTNHLSAPSVPDRSLVTMSNGKARSSP